jgi:hypothetical protein
MQFTDPSVSKKDFIIAPQISSYASQPLFVQEEMAPAEVFVSTPRDTGENPRIYLQQFESRDPVQRKFLEIL